MIRKNLTASLFLMTALSLTTALQSCSKIGKLLNYNLAMQSASVTVSIPPAANTGTNATFGSGDNTYNIDSFIRANTLGALGINNITSVKLLSCVLTLQNATPQNNFANLASCMASFATGNVEPYSIGISNNPNNYSTTLTLPVDSTVELKSYLTGNHFTYSLAGQLRKATTDSLKCTVQFTFSINVQG